MAYLVPHPRRVAGGRPDEGGQREIAEQLGRHVVTDAILVISRRRTLSS
jgi:hypothetical protein